MRALGTGVDLQRVGDVERAVGRWGDRFLARVFTPGEIAYCRARVRMAQSLTARFAAKEAFRKAVGAAPGIRWRDIEIVRESGPPRLVLYGRARSVAGAMGVLAIHLSLSHSADYAVATVLLEGRP